MIQQISEHYVSCLPDGQAFYKVSALHQYDFPPFLIRQIEISLRQKVDEDLQQPNTPWADIEAPEVQQAWQQYQESSHKQARIPAQAASELIETAVVTIIKTITQPRAYIPQLLYGEETTLPAKEFKERLGRLVVYSHFVQVLEGYMERKGHQELEKARCAQIIQNVDEKLTRNYSPLQWAQLLDPLFNLSSQAIDASLFQTFFEDKAMPELANKFASANASVTRSQFIDILSSKDNGREHFSPESTSPRVAFDAPVASETAFQEQQQPMHGPSTQQTGNEGTSVGTEKKEPLTPEAESEEEQPIEKQESSGPTRETQDASRQPLSLNDVFGEGGSKPDETASGGKSLNDLFSSNETSPDKPVANKEPAQPQDGPKGSANTGAASLSQPSGSQEDADKQQEAPIWQHFSGNEEDKQEQGYNADTPKNKDDRQPQKTVSSVKHHESKPNRQQELAHFLEGQKIYFMRQLFGGSEQAYKAFLADIAQKEDWKDASASIKKNIFERPSVNMYSEAAVEFTDRLQTYFSKK